MSTKTSFKRIALVAVAALGMGVLTSVSPANAGASALALTQKAGTGDNGSGAVAGPANTVTVTLSSKNDATQSWGAYVTVTGGSINTVSGAPWTIPAGGGSAVLAQTTEGTVTPDDLVIATPTVGNVVVNVYLATAVGATTYTSTPDATLTVEVRAAAIAGKVSSAKSTSVISGGTDFTGAASDETVLSSNIPSTPVQAASILVTVLDGTGVSGAAVANAPVTATISGPGLLGINADETKVLIADTAASLRAVSLADSGSDGIAVITVAGDGTGNGGVATITISSGSVTLATETVTFYGKATSLVVTPVAGSVVDTFDGNTTITADADGVVATIKGKDALGNIFPLAASEFTAITSTVLTAQSLNAVAFADGDGDPVAATAAVVADPTSTKTGVKTLTVTHTSTTLTATISFVVALAEASSVTLSTDKATYLPGEKIVLKVTSKDAGSFAIPDQTATAGAYTITTSKAQDATLPTTATYASGVDTITLYAPASPGDFTISVKLATGNLWATALDDTTKEITVKVSTSTTEILALTTLINSLIKKINALSTLVAKIQKKLGVK
jgi:hypothetical protein